MALIEIDGLPFLKMVIFHGELLNNQMVEPWVDDLRNMLHEQWGIHDGITLK
jgi:hypothetical protein